MAKSNFQISIFNTQFLGTFTKTQFGFKLAVISRTLKICTICNKTGQTYTKNMYNSYSNIIDFILNDKHRNVTMIPKQTCKLNSYMFSKRPPVILTHFNLYF